MNGPKPPSKPIMYNTAMLWYIVGNLHVTTSLYSVARIVHKKARAWIGQNAMTPGGAEIGGRAMVLSAMRYAVGVHRLNRREYSDVVGARLGSTRKLSKAGW